MIRPVILSHSRPRFSRSNCLAALLGLACFLVSTQTWGQAQLGPACADCVRDTTAQVATITDQVLCPGANRVVCLYGWDREVAECSTANPGPFRECAVAGRLRNYVAFEYSVIGGRPTCGTSFGNGRVSCDNRRTLVVAPQPQRDSELFCVGEPWGVEPDFPVDALFSLGMETPRGPTPIGSGFQSLERTLITVETGLIETALDRGLLGLDGDHAYLELTITTDQDALHFVSLLERPFMATTSRGDLVIDDTVVDGTTITVRTRVPLATLGAFADYAFDIGGLLTFFDTHQAVTTSSEQRFVILPFVEAAPNSKRTHPYLPTPVVAADLHVGLHLSSGGQTLSEGYGLLGIAR